jgi:aryl-alcohol dehydrogenase-like predicted oxidoreductase
MKAGRSTTTQDPNATTPPLPTRALGPLRVPALGFGAMVLSPGMYGEVDEARAIGALRAAMDAGSTFLDTSDGYGPDGHNERLIGKAIAGRREDVVIATKFGFRMLPGAEPHRFAVGYDFKELAVNADPRYVRSYAEQSLRELGTDYIDLYYPHFPDPRIPLEETVGAVAELIDAGLVRHIGLSNVTAGQLRAAHAVHPIAAVQTEWSMWRPIDSGLLEAGRGLGVGFVAWSPLGGGFLTGGVTRIGDGDFRQYLPRFSGQNLATNNDRFAPIRAMARELDLTPGQLALAWLLAQDPAVVPIPGSRTPGHIAENIDAARTALHPDTLTRLNAVLDGISAEGATLL